jgi:hypothetical protein
MEVPGAAQFSVPCIGTPMCRGPAALGDQRAGTFGLFLLPGGRPRRFTPKLEDLAVAAEEAEGSMAQGRCLWERAVLEKASEVPRASRKKHLKAWPASKRHVLARKSKRRHSAPIVK